MKPSNDLYDLISSLTPNEKGYFKKQCQKSGATSRKYIKLFDAIAAQKVYDEKVLKKKLNDPILIRNLSSEKNYLYHLILEAVIGGNFSADPVLEMEMILSKAKWLSTHSFYEAAMRFVKKVRLWSHENELFTLQLEALDLEWLLWQYITQEERRSVDEIAEERIVAIEKLKNADLLRKIDIKVIQLFQESGIGRDESHLEKYRKLYDESREIVRGTGDEKGTSGELLSVRAKTYLYNISVFYHNVAGESEKSLEDMRELIRLLDENIVIKKERLSFYLSSLNNLILLLLHLGKFEEAKEKIKLLESVVPETQSHRNTVFITRYNTAFDLYTHMGDWNSAYNLSLELKKQIPEFEEKIDNRYTGHIRYAAFRSCFYAGHSKEALQWLNQIVQKTEGEPFKEELLTIARISELMIHETMEHYDLLERLTESAARYLHKTNNLYHFEKLMLDFFQEQLKVHPEKRALLKLQKELNQIEKNHLEERVFSYFNFKAWVDARINSCEISTSLIKN